jgi:hypothetical protein
MMSLRLSIALSLFVAGAVAFAGDGAPFGAFLGPCNSNADCQPGLSCQSFKQRGLRCTRSCEVDADCAAPSKGCSKQHRCKMPSSQ